MTYATLPPGRWQKGRTHRHNYALTEPDRQANGEAAEARSARSGEIIEPTLPPRASDAGAPAPATSTPYESYAVRRRYFARAIVERHATYSAVGGVIPLPIVNVASVTAIIIRMVKVLSDLYDVPFKRDRARAIVVGLVGGTLPTGLAAVATSTLHYIVPASALIGLAVSSVTAAACTRNIGRIFVDHFESGATLDDPIPSEKR